MEQPLALRHNYDFVCVYFFPSSDSNNFRAMLHMPPARCLCSIELKVCVACPRWGLVVVFEDSSEQRQREEGAKSLCGVVLSASLKNGLGHKLICELSLGTV